VRCFNPLGTPNGIGLSPDGATLYVSDTNTARLWSWDVAAPGAVIKAAYPAPIGGRYLGAVPGPARMDSLAVTASGRICVASIMVGGIAEFWADGSAMRFHSLPDLHLTNIAFGGADMRTAYTTWSQAGLLVALDWGEPGLRLHDGRR
jgi:gluconolactonase